MAAAAASGMQALQNPRNAAGGRAGSSGLALPHQQQQHRVVMISGSSSRHSRSRVVCPANAPLEGPAIPVSKADLIEHIRSGCKPRDRWRIGTEHEKLGFRLGDRRRMDYAEVRQVFDKLESRFGWKPIKEGDLTIGAALDGQTVTLEPGGQFELSGAPVATLHQTCAEVNSHLYQVKSIAEELGIGFLGAGFDPKWAIDEIPVMPKDRYRLMKAYMPTVGTRGLDMMFRTCTIQVNLDYESEADMVEKFKIGLALQPVAVALFANSPFKEGRPTGELSTRARVWMDVDKARTGGLPFVFEPGMSFERYVDYAMDVPMYFVYRKGKYIDALGQSWRDFMEGKLPALPGERPTISDWENHLTTIFPDVRLKRYLEMRGADGGPWRLICALPALWVGLLYDAQAQAEALDLIRGWSADEREYLRSEVGIHGLRTPFRGGTLRDVALEVLAIARGGLERRGHDEAAFLKSLQLIAESGRTPADALLELYEGKWGRSVDPMYDELAY